MKRARNCVYSLAVVAVALAALALGLPNAGVVVPGTSFACSENREQRPAHLST
jgi:hypothetical protein